MTANNGWPGKPRVPLNPERDGWHWLEDTVDGVGTGHIEAVYYAAWSVPTWYRAGNRSPIKNPENWIYLGPCLTPDEAAALQKRHEEAERTALQAAECHARETRRADALQKRVAELEGALAAAARVLHKAGEQFSEYAKQHTAKGTADGAAKAATNRQWAQFCFNAHDAAFIGGKDE